SLTCGVRFRRCGECFVLCRLGEAGARPKHPPPLPRPRYEAIRYAARGPSAFRTHEQGLVIPCHLEPPRYYARMDIEKLTKSQIVLLTLLVSFVTSIATGIVTVSLMDQAPPAIAQTVNRVIEHTIETVVASSTPRG